MLRNIGQLKAHLYSRRKNLLLLLLTALIALVIWLEVQRFGFINRSDRQSPTGNLNVGGKPWKNQLQMLLKCQNETLNTELVQHGDYWVLKNIIRGRRSINMGCAESITLTAFGDYSHLGFLEQMVTRWMGPISLALFAPGYDFAVTMEAIQYARHCSPVRRLIRDYVSFHIYFPNNHMPPQRIPITEKEALNWKFNCIRIYAPYEDVEHSEMYSNVYNLSFPINVGRNIAKKSVNTYFVFVCVISAYPSLRFIDHFLEMAVNNVEIILGDGQRPRVFALPVFELNGNAAVPDNKKQLMTMLRMKMARPLYEEQCRHCVAIPDQKHWLETPDSDELMAISVVRRYSNFPYWDPMYVSDNREPEFDERLTWDDPINKRLQQFAMCLQDYEYYILHPAFVTYHPGLSLYDDEEVEDLVGKTFPEYLSLYGNSTKCEI